MLYFAPGRIGAQIQDSTHLSKDGRVHPICLCQLTCSLGEPSSLKRIDLGKTSAMRGKAMLRIRDACFAHPEMVGGTGDGSTIIMQALKGRAFAKSGAEGGFIAALPEQGLGIALKVRDGGAGRAAEIAVAGLLESLLELSPNDSSTLKRLSNPPVLDRHGKPVGEARLVLPQS